MEIIFCELPKRHGHSSQCAAHYLINGFSLHYFNSLVKNRWFIISNGETDTEHLTPNKLMPRSA